MATAGFRERPGEEEDGHLQAAQPPDSHVAPRFAPANGFIWGIHLTRDR